MRINGIYDIMTANVIQLKLDSLENRDILVYEKYSSRLMGRVGIVVLKPLCVTCFTPFDTKPFMHMKLKRTVQVFQSYLLVRVLYVPFSITVPL
jgi:hypothetical protein